VKIQAVSTEKPNAIVAQAIDKQLRSLKSIMARAGIELSSVDKISSSALSKKLKDSGIEFQQRLTIKVALEKAGLLGD
jgi:hypothetical protein